jgi:hypothetical protein
MIGERLVAFERLLARPDERHLRRGHRVTQPGDPRRLEDVWWRCARVWMGHRLGRRGVIEGWTPARRRRLA